MNRYPAWLTDRPRRATADADDDSDDTTRDYRHPAAARQALRRLSSGVTVLTVNVDGVRHGTTASAVLALSREPLILGVCLRPTSTFATLVRRRGDFSVNVLGAGQARAARTFADPGRPLGDAQFTGHAWTPDPLSGAPLLTGSLSHLSCRVLGWHQVGDNDLLLASVTGGAHNADEPLLSHAGRMHDVTLTPLAAPAAPTHSEVS